MNNNKVTLGTTEPTKNEKSPILEGKAPKACEAKNEEKTAEPLFDEYGRPKHSYSDQLPQLVDMDEPTLDSKGRKLFSKIPLISGDSTDELHKSDREYRNKITSKLTEKKGNIPTFANIILQNGELSLLSALSNLENKFNRLIDIIQHTTYGGGTIFDSKKDRNEKLQKLIQFDSDFMFEIEELDVAIDNLNSAVEDFDSKAIRKGISKCSDIISTLDTKFANRENIIGGK